MPRQNPNTRAAKRLGIAALALLTAGVLLIVLVSPVAGVGTVCLGLGLGAAGGYAAQAAARDTHPS